MRGATFQMSATMVIEDCCACGVPFGLTQEMQDRLRKSHDTFYCPNGHRQSYTGPSDAEKRIKQLERQVEIRDGQIDFHREEAKRQKKAATQAKAALTRMRNRVARGVCPQAGCKRSFTNLHDHVATCHKDLLALVE